MWAIVQGWLTKNVLALLGYAAAAAAVAAVLLGARQAGRNAERVDRMKKTIEVQRDQLEAATRRPRDRDDLTRRMRDGTF
jgi:ActR/RegA family two-component response regulator